jgi:hypothetical protein
MLSLILYEFRSRWSGIVILLGAFLLWDLLIVWGLADIDILALTLLHLSSIGYLVILVGVNAFLFHTDYLTRHAFFISTTPSKDWMILLSKLIPIWLMSILLYSVHSILMILTYIHITDRTNTSSSLMTFCFHLFQMNCFLILLLTVSLLFFWIALLLVRIQNQNSTIYWIWVIIILAGGTVILLFSLQSLFVSSLANQNIINWQFPILKPLTYLILIFLTFILFWIAQDLLKHRIDQ